MAYDHDAGSVMAAKPASPVTAKKPASTAQTVAPATPSPEGTAAPLTISKSTAFLQKLFKPTKDNDLPDTIVDEEAALAEQLNLLHRLTKQSLYIAVAAIIFVLALPFFQTRYHYYGLTPDHKVSALAPLTMPNMTDGAVRSWAATSVTEIMTFGFGDMDAKLLLQRRRFTSLGWSEFVHTFLDKKIGTAFQKSQLVLTTVPAEDPQILNKEVNTEHIYEWKVKVPIIMTYATNNEVTKPEHGTVTLTIVRVPYDENSGGIAIQTWSQR